MRCDEVIRELAAPTADRDPAAMADHLVGCPACAEWARRAEGLDRLWEATRPAAPSPEAWDAVWAGIAQALPSSSPSLASPPREDSPTVGAGLAPSRNGVGPKLVVHPEPERVPVPAPARAPAGGRGWRLAAVALVGLAQAAAVLVALGLAWRVGPGPDGPRTASPSIADLAPPTPAGPVAIRAEQSIDLDADFEAGSLMVIQVGPRSGRVEDRTPPEMNVSADIGMEMTNAMESIATPQVAAR